jgi:iron(III) transport system permease protein
MALVAFLATAILPLIAILAYFVIGLILSPSAITHVLLDSRQFVLLNRSVTVAVSATAVALLLGLPTAIVLTSKDLPYRRLFYFLVLIPLLIPPYIMAGAWIHLLSPNGLLNRLLTVIFGPGALLSVSSLPGCAWCLGISFFPLIAIVVGTGLSQIDSNLVDIARLSTGQWGIFRYAIVPQIWPHIIASICLVIIFVIGQYSVPSLLGVNTYPVEIFSQFSAFYNDTAAVATALPLIVLVIFLILLQKWVMLSHNYIRITPSSETRSPIKLGGFKYYAVVFLTALFLVTFLCPFSSVLAHTQSPGKIWRTLYSSTESIMTTSILALLATIFATVIAFPIGQYLAYRRTRFARILDILCWLPIAIPGTVIGLGLVKLSNLLPSMQKLDSVGILLVCAYVGMFGAFSVRIFEAAYRRVDPNIEEAAAIDCQRWYQRLLYVDIPIHSGAIAASMVIVFVLAIGELNATVLLIPPGKATLSVTIDNLLHYGANVQASILCLVEALLVLSVVSGGLLVWCIVGKRQK